MGPCTFQFHLQTSQKESGRNENVFPVFKDDFFSEIKIVFILSLEK